MTKQSFKFLSDDVYLSTQFMVEYPVWFVCIYFSNLHSYFCSRIFQHFLFLFRINFLFPPFYFFHLLFIIFSHFLSYLLHLLHNFSHLLSVSFSLQIFLFSNLVLILKFTALFLEFHNSSLSVSLASSLSSFPLSLSLYPSIFITLLWQSFYVC